MAFVNSMDLGETAHLLRAWLAAELPDARDVRVGNVEVPQETGRSSEILMFDASWSTRDAAVTRQLVARIAPSADHALFPDYDLGREYELMRLLGHSPAVPVPACHWYVDDVSVLGRPFLVMERVRGRVPPDSPPYSLGGWVLEQSVPKQRRLQENGIRALAAIHTADVRVEVLRRSGRGLNGLDETVDYYERFLNGLAPELVHPNLWQAFKWIKVNQPERPRREVICWGDARIGNIMFDDSQEVVAVLDWEIAGLGPPEMDLGYWLFFERHHTEGIGAPPVPGFASPEVVVALYEELTGFEVEDLHFYTAFAALRSAVTMVRIGELLGSAEMAIANPCSRLLAEILELPRPDGAVNSPI